MRSGAKGGGQGWTVLFADDSKGGSWRYAWCLVHELCPLSIGVADGLQLGAEAIIMPL